MEFAQNGQRITDIEDYCKNLPSVHTWTSLEIPAEEYEVTKTMMYEFAALLGKGTSEKQSVQIVQRKFHRTLKPSQISQVYLHEKAEGHIQRNLILENALITRRCRSISGVSVVSIFLSPYPNGQKFTCQWDCAYCPNEPGQPRSYLFGEPGVLRANQNNFDCVGQVMARINTYKVNGHPTDKFEVLILGGTIHSYPKDYLEDYMRDIYYAANTCEDDVPLRERGTLAYEKSINTDGSHRVIGITVETRPDCVNASELRTFRRWGVTRVQIGVQHTDDDVLLAVNRRCSHRHTLRALKMLRDSCFKCDIHLMPNLPSSTPEKDKRMIDVVLADLHPDQVKLYPCETIPFTKILEDFKSGEYVPYSNEDLEDVVLYWKSRVHPWIRNSRVVRDIPDRYIVCGVKSSSQRCEFQELMRRRGLVCRCIRCREAGRHKGDHADPKKGELVVRTYEAQGGTEHFISWESVDREVLFGFLRLRLGTKVPDALEPVFPELEGCALIRELHVYGHTVAVGTEDDAVNSMKDKMTVAQHLGIGRRLMEEAEMMARAADFKRVAVISGVGVRNYYARLGYVLDCGAGEFMMKDIGEEIADERNITLLTFTSADERIDYYLSTLYLAILGWIIWMANPIHYQVYYTPFISMY